MVETWVESAMEMKRRDERWAEGGEMPAVQVHSTGDGRRAGAGLVRGRRRDMVTKPEGRCQGCGPPPSRETMTEAKPLCLANTQAAVISRSVLGTVEAVS